MKRIFGLITICSVLALPVLATAPVSFGNSGDHSLHATDVHLVKKLPLPPIVGEVKGNPHGSPPGQDGSSPGRDKNKEEGTASGMLGDYPVTGTKYAIIIGICDYPGTANDLCNSDGDSLRMYKALIALYGYDQANIRLFKDGGGTTHFSNVSEIPEITAEIPTRSNILGAIESLNPSSDDEIVFFFSGHGADGLVNDDDNERRDEGIVVHKDNASGLDSDYTYIWDGELKAAFSDFATNRIAFIFDTCLAGGMNDLAYTGRVISMGTNETQPAYVYSSEKVNPDKMEDVDKDGQFDGEGVFTHYFVNEGMLQGLADVYDHDSDATTRDVVIEEAFDYAKEIIPSIWKRQKPTISDKFTDDLLL